MTRELRLNDKNEPDTQGLGEENSKQRDASMQKLDTEPRTSPGHTKDRKKAGAEEGRGDDEGSRGGPGPTARIKSFTSATWSPNFVSKLKSVQVAT